MLDRDVALRIREFLERHHEQMVDDLAELVRMESPSNDPEALTAVLDVLEAHFAGDDYYAFRRPGEQSGGQLYVRPRHRGTGAYQVVIGHCDTVWPRGTIQQMPLVRDGRRMRGPGIYDMKGGLVQMVWAFRALRKLELRPEVLPVGLITSDEEVRSEEAYDLIVRLARGADRALVLEPSLGRSGKLKTARKGVGDFQIRIRGRSAHAGLDPESGASAIVELSHVIQKVHALNDPGRGITLNVGQIEGGLRANVVAPESRAVLDARVPTQELSEEVTRRIRAIEPVTPGVKIEIEGEIRRPPMERTERNVRLWEQAHEVGELLGLDLEEGRAGGGSDGNYTSLYTATLDGLGAVGDGAHASHEFVFVDKLVERTALLALILLSGPVQERAGRSEQHQNTSALMAE